MLNKTKTGEQDHFQLFSSAIPVSVILTALSCCNKVSRRLDVLKIHKEVYKHKPGDGKWSRNSRNWRCNICPCSGSKKITRRYDSLLQLERIKATLERDHNLPFPRGYGVPSNGSLKILLAWSLLPFRNCNPRNSIPDTNCITVTSFSKDGKRLTFFLDLNYPASETGKNAISLSKKHDTRVKVRLDCNQGYTSATLAGRQWQPANSKMRRRYLKILTLRITIILLLALTFICI